MAGSQDGETPARQQVTAGPDACVAGGDLGARLAPLGESRDAAEPGTSFGRAAGVHVGSGNVQVSNFSGDPTRTDTGATPLMPVSGAAGSPDRSHAFISYVREDSGEVGRLQRMLQAAGIPVWRDTASLWPGEDWRARIRDAITRDALVFIACFSSHSAARRASYQNEELRLATDQLRLRWPDDPWLVPVRFDSCDVPDFELGAGRTLASIQRADLFGPSRDLAARRLVAAVQRLLRQPPLPIAEPSAPFSRWTFPSLHRRVPAPGLWKPALICGFGQDLGLITRRSTACTTGSEPTGIVMEWKAKEAPPGTSFAETVMAGLGEIASTCSPSTVTSHDRPNSGRHTDRRVGARLSRAHRVVGRIAAPRLRTGGQSDRL
jgi:hypothetical protein